MNDSDRLPGEFSPPPEQKTCGNCAWSVKGASADAVICRRHPWGIVTQFPAVKNVQIFSVSGEVGESAPACPAYEPRL